MSASRQPHLLWYFIVAYKQATGKQLSYVNLSRDVLELKQTLMQAKQIRDTPLQRAIEELELTLPEVAIDVTVAESALQPQRQPTPAENQGYVDMIGVTLKRGAITLEQRQNLDAYCLEHGITLLAAELLERQWRNANKAAALSWRDEFKRSLTAIDVRGNISETERLRLYRTYIQPERLTAAEAELLTVSVMAQPHSQWQLFQQPIWSSSLAVAAAVVVALVLGLPWLAPVYEKGALSSAEATRDGNTPPPIPANLKPMLRLHGSNTLGAHLIPTLAELYLSNLGNVSIKRKSDLPENEMHIYGNQASRFQLIEIKAHGSGTAFTSLEAGLADIGASSRPIKDKELERLKVLGDLTGFACEHVIALDGVAVIIHPNNPLTTLSKEQIAAVFAGEIKNWQELGNAPSMIRIHARDDKSGTYDSFNHLVMGKLKIAPQALRYESNDALSDQVAIDPAAIGFVSLPAVRGSKALAVSDGGNAILPTRFTIATEDYPLSRRLFLYTPTSSNQIVQKFLQLAYSDVGQAVVAQVGFVDLRPELQNSAHVASAPERYLKLTHAAKRLSLNFRFRADDDTLDNKAEKDLTRLIGYLSQTNKISNLVLLLGFSANTGDVAQDQKRSEIDAGTMAAALQMRGIYPSVVEGFGSALPLANNADSVGRVKNRRVEIWLR